jgi:hypothetical protein
VLILVLVIVTLLWSSMSLEFRPLAEIYLDLKTKYLAAETVSIGVELALSTPVTA